MSRGATATAMGLYLQINPNGVKSWLFRFDRGGRERWLGLGPLHTVDLAEARERARLARVQLLDGIDPVEAKAVEKVQRQQAAAKELTFEQAVLAYFEQHEAKWKSVRHRAQFLARYANTFSRHRQAVGSDIDTAVLKVIEPIWPTKTETADRVRGRIEAVLDWATVRGYRTGDNPARWKRHLSEVLPARQDPKTEHHAACPTPNCRSSWWPCPREGIAAARWSS